tara:strand:- start:1028 stop:1264 length:237 start_codon:yes stop_codon:yes gene_type:complete
MKFELNHFVSVIILGVVSWGAITLFTMNAQMAVVVYKVDQNFNMIQPMWQDFLQRRAIYDNVPVSNEPTDFQAALGEK